ncbi:MAG: AAA family ATPase [Cyclobacteriaceae bacterium]|nr:AAA family ATPase [Cyclobacteriaceae bacterium]
MTKNTIILTGLAGSGKTTLGHELARKLELPFIDLDHAIEEKAAETIPDIFKNKGEPYFREIEAQTLREVVGHQQQVILAVGGGTPCFFENMDFMNSEAETIYLEVSPQEIVKRLSLSNLNTRPLFKGLEKEELLQKISTQLEERELFYKQAKHTLSGVIGVEKIIAIL